ncbi:MAG: arsenic resistance protein [Pseudomonadota bacterium]
MTDRSDSSGALSGPTVGTTVLVLAAIAVGAVLGLSQPDLGASLSQGIDPTLLAIVGLLFFEVRLGAVKQSVMSPRVSILAWAANFLIIPFIGYAIAALFLSGQPLLFTGLVIYFLAPCTDWFLAFTRMARGDTALGAALLPINMLTQLLLYPLWLLLFTSHTGVVDFQTIPNALLSWFVVPFIVAQMLRCGLSNVLSAAAFKKICAWVGAAIPVLTAALVLQIFAANITVIATHFEAFGLVLAAIFCFFVITYGVAEGLSRLFNLSYRHQVVLAMTTAARNAPLMLAVTAIAIPDQPLVYAALIIGMLVEFPHLAGLKQVLISRVAGRKGPAGEAHSTPSS